MKTNAAYSEEPFTNIHQDLINGCKKGDQKAQFKIYKLYYKAMYNTSLGIVNNTMEAEDIMQESFLAAFEKIASYSGTVSFGAWLKKIVQNRSFDSLGKKRNLVFEDIDSLQSMEEDTFEVEYRNEELNLRIRKVLEIIKKLPARCRNILSLHLFEGYDHEEIGNILSISSSSSRSQFSRARQKVLRGLENK
jgi:RNA polymerase sigma factor (sigma-70 family)